VQPCESESRRHKNEWSPVVCAGSGIAPRRSSGNWQRRVRSGGAGTEFSLVKARAGLAIGFVAKILPPLLRREVLVEAGARICN